MYNSWSVIFLSKGKNSTPSFNNLLIYVKAWHLYWVESTKSAVVYVLKSLYALQLEYLKETEYVWMILQVKIYEIKSESDREVPSIKKLIKDMKD